jgi:hypothetical protein
VKLHAEGQWPTRDVACNPWQAAWPTDDMGWSDLSRSTLKSRLTRADHMAAVTALQDALDAAWSGEHVTIDDLQTLCAPLQIETFWSTDAAAPELSPLHTLESHIVRITCDHAPTAGMLAPDLMLGPWFDALNFNHPPHRRTSAWCVAHWGCSRVADRWPTRAWSGTKPVPDVKLRAAVRAIVRAPLGIWRIQQHGDRWSLHDRLGISKRMVAPHSLDLTHAAGLGALQDGATVLLRAVPSDAGWRAFAPIVLPADPPDHVIKRVVTLQLIARRVRNRRAHVEDALRDRAHLVTNALHLWSWFDRA